MSVRSKFVVGTVNGKVVSYIVDEKPKKLPDPAPPQSADAASTSHKSVHSNFVRPATSSGVTSHDYGSDPARINGSVTLTQAQLADLLQLLERHQHYSSPVTARAQEAWLSCASSCGDSLTSTPAPQTPAPATPGPLLVDEDSADSRAFQSELYCGHPSYSGYHVVTPAEREDENSQSESCSDRQPGMKPPLSLLEQKKLKWAKEREELEGMCAPWGRNKDPAVSLYNSQEYHKYNFEQAYEKQKNIYLHDTPPSSLPGIGNEHTLYSSCRSERATPSPLPPAHVTVVKIDEQTNSSRDKLPEFHTTSNRAVRFTSTAVTASRTPGEGQEQEEGRSRWGDKGVGVGHLWEPSPEPSARLPDPSTSPAGYPAWLERGLSRMGPSPDPGEGKNFLRGQNVPIDPMIMEERERKRQKAIEHQTAIKQQLEERERRRKEDREKRLVEERKEEERIRREQELERVRMEQERKKDQEAREAKHAAKANASSKKSQPKVDKPINLSPRIVDVTQRTKPDYSVVENYGEDLLTGLPQQLSELQMSKNEINRYLSDLQMHRGNQPGSLLMTRDDENGSMMMLGQEVAVLLAPELEERLLNSRTAREVATQTESQQSQISGVRGRRCRATTDKTTNRPLWGAHRSTQQYMKQSDKDRYRTRGTSNPAPARSNTQRQRSTHTAESTEDSDRSPPVCLTRRRAAQSKSTPPRRCRNQSSDDDSPHGKHAWSCNDSVCHTQVWRNPERLVVSGSETKIKEQPELYQTPTQSRRDHKRRPPIKSPPVPALAKKLQESSAANQLPDITDLGNKSAPPALQARQLQSPALLPEIRSRELNSALPTVDILSQLSTLRRALQSKQNEWELRSDSNSD